MLVDINIPGYRNIYFQAYDEGSAWTEQSLHLVAQAQPYPDNFEVKEPYKNSWLDEDGDEEYVDYLFRKSFEFEVKFYIKAFGGYSDVGEAMAEEQIVEQRKLFRNRLLYGEFRYFDSWNNVGFRRVRFVKETTDEHRVEGGCAWMIFTVTFKANDPRAVELSGNSLVDA